MSSYMTAHFSVEGRETGQAYEVDPEAEPITVTVSLITDGRYVKLDIVRRYGDSPALTPRGWAQLAEAAAALVSNATSAWESMGAEPRGEA